MLVVRRSGTRPVTRAPGVEVRHAFGGDEPEVRHGALLAHDEHRLTGAFPAHPHRGVELVSWVVAGALHHEDSTGCSTLVPAGSVHRTAAGTGVEHTETAVGDLHLVQAWLEADPPLGPPSCALADATAALAGGRLAPVASGLADVDAPLRLVTRDAALHAGRLVAGTTAVLPQARRTHLHVVRGTVRLEPGGLELRAGDAVRTTDQPAARVHATTDAEVLVWELRGPDPWRPPPHDHTGADAPPAHPGGTHE